MPVHRAFIEDETRPLCLGYLRGCEICPVCHADLAPGLDAVEEWEAKQLSPIT